MDLFLISGTNLDVGTKKGFQELAEIPIQVQRLKIIKSNPKNICPG